MDKPSDDLTWFGKPLSELSREELIEAVRLTFESLTRAHVEIERYQTQLFVQGDPSKPIQRGILS